MSDVTTIPAAVLAEAHKVYCGGRFAGFEEALAVIARHWPAATPDRYAAGFRDGVEKAAAAFHSTTALLSRGEIITAIRALAPPDDGLVVGRLRWVNDGTKLLLGNAWAGWIERMYRSHKWSAYLRDAFISATSVHLALHDTPEAARAALVAAVRREVEGGDHAA